MEWCGDGLELRQPRAVRWAGESSVDGTALFMVMFGKTEQKNGSSISLSVNNSAFVGWNTMVPVTNPMIRQQT